MIFNNISVGVDCVEISRFDNVDENFFKKVFSERERNYCESKILPLEHYAARFAGKEAVIKAISGFVDLKDIYKIEILNEESGKPYVKLNGKISATFEFSISLSHSKKNAIAFVIANKI